MSNLTATVIAILLTVPTMLYADDLSEISLKAISQLIEARPEIKSRINEFFIP